VLPYPPPNPTIEEVMNAIISYVGPLYGEDEDMGPIVNLELSIILSDAINGYINSAAGSSVHYDRRQQEYAFQLLEGVKAIPEGSIVEHIRNIEENIATSGMSSEQQAPLLMATSLGKASYEYFRDGMLISPWNTYLSERGTGFLPFLISATMEGALLGAKLMGLKTTKLGTISLAGMNAISSLSAALMLAAGKVIFNWQPRVSEVK